MDPIDSSDKDAVGWHLIARGGDMTARVHSHMQLGVLPSGDFSFEPPDAVVELDTRDEHLSITVVSPQFELEMGDGQRTRDLIVSPQTHVRLEFLGHLLDIDNDFAVSSATADALEIHVVREGEPRVLPESATQHSGSGEIIVAEQFMGRRSSGMDSLQREHAAVRTDNKLVVERRPGVGRIAGALAGSILIVTALAVIAIYVAERSTAPEATPITEAVSGSEPVESPGPAGSAGLPEPEISPGAGPDVLARFTALVEMEPLPDKATLDFAVESLKSLRMAYPEDPGVPAALTQLSERLVVEARTAYDRGDAFLAGRLIEQAATIGLATTSVDETLAYFASKPPGTVADVQLDEDSTARVIEAPSVTSEIDQQPQAENVESIVTSAQETTREPVSTGSAEPVSFEAVAVPAVSVSASRLPAGFPEENVSALPLSGGNQEPVDALVERDSERARSGPIFRPFSELIVTEQEPLTYPRRALDGAEGSVDVEFTVTETGEVSALSISGDAPAVFLQEAARAIGQWRFQPVLVNGVAVPVQTGLRVTFRG